MAKSFEAMIKGAKYAMVIGIGGGGDVVGTIPNSRYLRWLGLRTVIGGLTWERYVNDPEPGPRKMEEIVDIQHLSPTVGLASGRTKTTKGIRFTESIVAEVLKENTILIDLNQGVQGVIKGLSEAIDKLGVDFFLGIDVGGDVLGEGTEEGLHSMLADSMMLAAMVNLKVPTVLGVLGGGCDGELTFEQFNRQIAKIASLDGFLGARGLTPEDVEALESVIPYTKTEASALACKAARGVRGEIEIRGGYRKVILSPLSAMTFYLDPKVVFEKVSSVTRDLVPTRTLDEAQAVLEGAKVPSELTFERNFVLKKYADKDKLLTGGQK